MDPNRLWATQQRLFFDGDEEKFELWLVKFTQYLKLKNLPIDDISDEEDEEKNEQIFAHLVQFLDDKSLSLIIRDASDDGIKALEILKDHYLGDSKPRIIALYTELTTLKMSENDSTTSYLIRAEKAASALKNVGETVSDGLLVAMVLKGLPQEYQAFCTVMTQKRDELKFMDLKKSLKSHEESEKSRKDETRSCDNKFMKIQTRPDPKLTLKCYTCGQPGHKSPACKYKIKKWCDICNNATHNTDICRRRNYAKMARDDDDDDTDKSFLFTVSNKPCSFEEDFCSILVDCGATAHIVKDKSKFIKLDKDFDSSKHTIELADGSRTKNLVKARGDASFSIHDNEGCEKQIILHDALFIPSYSQNILSVQSAIESGAKITFSPNEATFETPNGTTFELNKNGKLYFLNSVKTRSHSLKQWHDILGHCNLDDVLQLESAVKGMKINDKSKFDCDTCAKGKMCQYRNKAPDKKADSPLYLVHCDLAGPIGPTSINHSKYAMTFVDDYSGLIIVYFLKDKSQTSEAIEKFLADMAPYGSVKILRTDNGTEFTNYKFRDILIRNKIKQQFSSPYSPHQNGTAERSWRSLFEMARCLLIQSRLPKKLWNYAVRISAHIRNRCFNRRTEKTPFEMFTLKKPDISNMHIFGSTCFAYIQNPSKLEPRSEKGIFIGYDPQSPAYLIYFPESEEIKRVRSVIFHETTPLNASDEFKKEENNDILYSECFSPSSPQNIDEGGKGDNSEILPETENAPRRQVKTPKYLEDFILDSDYSDKANCSIDYCYRIRDIPKTYEEAMISPEANKWQNAMSEEMTALTDNDTYQLTPIPKDKKVIGGRWVYAVKIGPNGEEKFKARYVAKGYSQIENIDYKETFSPTAKITSIRMLAQIAVEENLILHQMDFKTAYLNADIDCDIYLEQPKGFTQTNEQNEKLVFKLKKSLYGLKQSGRNWNNLLQKFLTGQNFQQSLNDYCVYTRISRDSKIIILSWVDDLLIAVSDLKNLNDIKRNLAQNFKMKDLGQLKYFLGIEFEFDENTIKMSQTKYLQRILDRFGMSDCNPKTVPCDMSTNKNNITDSKELPNNRIYREIVGSLIYAMICTRPDLCYIVTKLSQHLEKPTKEHLNLCKHVLKYIKGTLNQTLNFKKIKNELCLSGFCDSDWANSDDRKSISGYCFRLNDDGPLISWKSKKQSTVALSTCEAEYMALCYAMQEANFLRQLFRDFTDAYKPKTNIFVDNQGAIALAKNPIHHQRSKHIDVKYHYIRDQILENNITLEYIPSSENVADIFTKPVNKIRLQKFKSING